MSTFNWLRSDNFFYSYLIKSYIGAKAIFNSVDFKLNSGIADAEILAIYTPFNACNTTFNTKYATWSSLKSINPSTTQSVSDLLIELRAIYSMKWDVATQNIYTNKTTRYKALFPHRRNPFQTGTIASRIDALNNLVAAIGTDLSMAAIKAEIVTFLSLLSTALATQGTQDAAIATAQTELDAIIFTLSQQIMLVYAKLLVKFFASPKTIDNYLPVELLHNIKQVSFIVTLNSMVPKLVVKRKMEVTTNIINAINNGSSTVQAYFTNGITSTPDVDQLVVTMPPQSSSAYNPTEMGYTDAKRFLYIVATDLTVAAIQLTIV